jgi:prephenate dehydrogenase
MQQIDRDLIELLRKKISSLATSKLPSIEEQISNCAPLLEKAGVPEFVWKNLIITCVAALATTPSHPTPTKPRQVTIIGGRGMMGSFFTARLCTAGHKVSILERDDWNDAEKLLSKAELVLVCVPIKSTLDTIRNAAKYLTPETALADITSIKTPIMRAMLEHHKGPVAGLHPMFGPGVKSFLSQKIVVCPGRGDEAFQWFLNTIEEEGGKLIVCTPEEHDRMMVTIQAIRHFSTFSLGVFLAEEGIDIPRSLEFSSPIYRLEVDMVSRLFAQDPSLYMSIMLAEKERCEAIARLVDTYDRLAQLVMQRDRSALIQEFEKASNTFREEAVRALEESNHAIDSLSTLLAAKDAYPSESAASEANT